eukprot:TRINITY_DN29450_c0_g1_i1.p1 TRINITY_DN29450_c0_g1~~TRINITY_DN29450_c0_g1_i1.p1  ORF type:complete len:886 (-),score=134.08 TRINITY_DN29450_c0_g1_i1:86-2653(-)
MPDPAKNGTDSQTIQSLKEENASLKSLLEEMQTELNEMDDSVPKRPRRPSKQSNSSELSAEQSLAIAVDLVIERAEESDVGEPGFRVDPRAHLSVILGSALSRSKPVQIIIYVVALVLVLCVIVAKSPLSARELGWLSRGDSSPGAPSVFIHNIALCISCAGLLAFLVSLVKQPIILGYLVGGVLVGPIGLDIVHNQDDVQDFSSLGLVFLLFMIGLELDVSEFLGMGRVVIGTGIAQFPLCLVCMIGVFTLLAKLGLPVGEGQFAELYCAASCSISSTMIVVKLLGENAESESSPGRLSIGILIFQDLWAIVVLALQPTLENPQALVLLRTFGMIVGLVFIAMAYAKWVMPALLLMASTSVELMLVVALAWCFFICCLASFPAIGLSMELGALVSGVALATFPYSAEFNGKIRYIRDFFITLFFVGLGMQIPPLDVQVLSTAMVIAFVALAARWIGMYGVIRCLGGSNKLAVVSTINLSQTSEFGLVICTLGVKFGHIGKDTLTLIIWTFALLAVLSANVTKHNYRIYGSLAARFHWCCGRKQDPSEDLGQNGNDGNDFHTDRDIIFLGFSNVGALLLSDLEHTAPQYLRHIHVVDARPHIMDQIRSKGVACSYGDITSADVLEHAYHGEARLVIISTPDALLHCTSNLELMKLSKKVWPKADVICTADNHFQAHVLYEAGADYVLRMAKICAERLKDVIQQHTTHAVHHRSVGEHLNLVHIFEQYKTHDDDEHLSHMQLGGQNLLAKSVIRSAVLSIFAWLGRCKSPEKQIGQKLQACADAGFVSEESNPEMEDVPKPFDKVVPVGGRDCPGPTLLHRPARSSSKVHPGIEVSDFLPGLVPLPKQESESRLDR